MPDLPPALPVRALDADIEEERRAEKAFAMVMAARVALRRSNREEARRQLQQALVMRPNDAAAIEVVGDMFLEEGEQEKALKVFEQGRALHPDNPAFQEKIAICHLDLAEMQRDRDVRNLVLQSGDTDKWLDRKPGVALSLSLVVPGIGQFYNDEPERGWCWLAAMAVTFLGWYLPLNAALHVVEAGGGKNLVNMTEQAVRQLSGFAWFLFWSMFLLWNCVYLAAGWDAWQGAERVNEQRRRSLGM